MQQLARTEHLIKEYELKLLQWYDFRVSIDKSY